MTSRIKYAMLAYHSTQNSTLGYPAAQLSFAKRWFCSFSKKQIYVSELSCQEQLLRRNVKRLRGGLESQAHRLSCHSTLGSRVIRKKEEGSPAPGGDPRPRPICPLPLPVAGFRVQSSGFRVQGSGFRVQGSEFRVQGAEFRIEDLGFEVSGFGVRVPDWGFGV